MTTHDEIKLLRQLVKDFIDPDDCDYDHHGYCQTHGWFETDPVCPHKRAKEYLQDSHHDFYVEDTPLTVCMDHKCFVPCRRCDRLREESEDGWIGWYSSDPIDIAAVLEYQRNGPY